MSLKDAFKKALEENPESELAEGVSKLVESRQHSDDAEKSARDEWGEKLVSGELSKEKDVVKRHRMQIPGYEGF